MEQLLRQHLDSKREADKLRRKPTHAERRLAKAEKAKSQASIIRQAATGGNGMLSLGPPDFAQAADMRHLTLIATMLWCSLHDDTDTLMKKLGISRKKGVVFRC
jgi:hypothetical protein